MERTVLLYYFSGTGNSRRLTEVVARTFEEAGFGVQVENLEHIKQNALPEDHNCYSCHGFIFPVHAFGIPRIMARFMEALPRAVAKEAFIVVSIGNEEYGIPPTEGKCLSQGKRMLEKRGYKLVGADAVPMPNNWIAGLSAPTPEKVASVLEAGEKAVREFTEKIVDGRLPISESHLLSKLLGLINPFFVYGLKYMSTWLFRLDARCNSCEICAKICPFQNIKMVDGRPKWGEACEQCFRCINLCPKESIQSTFIGRTEKRRRYREPHLQVKDLIRG
jgi:ferredoxin